MYLIDPNSIALNYRSASLMHSSTNVHNGKLVLSYQMMHCELTFVLSLGLYNLFEEFESRAWIRANFFTELRNANSIISQSIKFFQLLLILNLEFK